jgi:hypothetical protein
MSVTAAEQIEEVQSSPELMCSVTIDDFGDARPQSAQRSSDAYAPIGLALSRAEASFWKVGMPWLPPSGRVCKLRSKRYSSPEELLRYELVGVSTPSLITYCEDLERSFTQRLEHFSIAKPSQLERWSLALLGSILFGAGAWLVTVATAAEKTLYPFVGALLAALSCAVLCVSLSSDSYRRESFLAILRREIARRSGESPGGSGKLQICPTADA